MLAILRDVIVLLSAGLTWEPGAHRQPERSLPVGFRIQATAETETNSPTISGPA
jgi:hypothetical protein